MPITSRSQSDIEDDRDSGTRWEWEWVSKKAPQTKHTNHDSSFSDRVLLWCQLCEISGQHGA